MLRRWGPGVDSRAYAATLCPVDLHHGSADAGAAAARRFYLDAFALLHFQ